MVASICLWIITLTDAYSRSSLLLFVCSLFGFCVVVDTFFYIINIATNIENIENNYTIKYNYGKPNNNHIIICKYTKCTPKITSGAMQDNGSIVFSDDTRATVKPGFAFMMSTSNVIYRFGPVLDKYDDSQAILVRSGTSHYSANKQDQFTSKTSCAEYCYLETGSQVSLYSGTIFNDGENEFKMRHGMLVTVVDPNKISVDDDYYNDNDDSDNDNFRSDYDNNDEYETVD
jgi:hypothetical protein